MQFLKRKKKINLKTITQEKYLSSKLSKHFLNYDLLEIVGDRNLKLSIVVTLDK